MTATFNINLDSFTFVSSTLNDSKLSTEYVEETHSGRGVDLVVNADVMVRGRSEAGHADSDGAVPGLLVSHFAPSKLKCFNFHSENLYQFSGASHLPTFT